VSSLGGNNGVMKREERSSGWCLNKVGCSALLRWERGSGAQGSRAYSVRRLVAGA
jgi:hypothetical protein